jgi:hypothetical protein
MLGGVGAGAGNRPGYPIFTALIWLTSSESRDGNRLGPLGREATFAVNLQASLSCSERRFAK